jgi:PTS system nitrogen regulatory IIA component
MKLLDFLGSDAIMTGIKIKDKEALISEMVKRLEQLKKINNTTDIIEALLQREQLGSTGIGNGIALPHVKTANVKKLVGSLAVVNGGVDFNSMDGNPVNLIFLVLSPADNNTAYLNAMANISRLFRDKMFRNNILEAKSSEEIINIIKEADNNI